MTSEQLMFKQIEGVFDSLPSKEIIIKAIEFPIVQQLMNYGVMWLFVFLLIGIMWEMTKVIIFDKEGSLMMVLVTSCIAAFSYVYYINFIIWFVEYADSIANSILSSDLIFNTANVEGDVFSQIADRLKFGYELVTLDGSTIFIQLTTFIVLLSVKVINILRIVLILMYVVIGTTALSTLPFEILRPYSIGWLSSIIQVSLWPVIMSIILMLQAIVTNIIIGIGESVEGAGLSLPESFDLATYNLVYISLLIGVVGFFHNLKKGTGFSVGQSLLLVGSSLAMRAGMKYGVKGLKVAGSKGLSKFADGDLYNKAVVSGNMDLNRMDGVVNEESYNPGKMGDRMRRYDEGTFSDDHQPPKDVYEAVNKKKK